jgi:thiamine biosynthesis lipoprotein
MLAVKTTKSNSNIFRRAIWLMGNQFEISIVANDVMWAEERIANAINEINRVEKLLSAFTDNSNVTEINRNAGIQPVKVNPEIFWLIDRAIKISELTYGAFDITYFSGDKEVAAANNKSTKTLTTFGNYQSVVLDDKAMTVFLKEEGMRISFAANSKGYAADRAKYILQTQGVSSGVINAGGDLLTWGLQPDNQPWTVAAADPELQNVAYANLNISDMCIATSINSNENTAVANKQIIKKINPKKGFPVSGIVSMSVVSPSAELSGAMANPMIAIGINAGLYLVNKLNQIGCVVIDDHERVYTSKGIKITE